MNTVDKELQKVVELSILYKELENENYKQLLQSKSVSTAILNVTKTYGENLLDREIIRGTEKLTIMAIDNTNPPKEIVTFNKTMRLLLVCGQVLGLNPVLGVLEDDSSKLRFKFLSWKCLYSVFLCITQAIAMMFCCYRLFNNTVNISTLAFVSFYGSTCATTFIFMRVASKWPTLARDVSTSALNEYIDPSIKGKCNTATIILLCLALLEHVLSFIARTSMITDCYLLNTDVYRGYIEINFQWFFEVVPYYMTIGIFLQVINLAATMIWNFSDVFIICISYYLASILERINNKIISSKRKNLPVPYWRSLREDYTRATRLVRTFDDVISSVVLVSFASNLFFICLQLFNVVAHGVKGFSEAHCPNVPSGPFGGYEHAIYFYFSLVLILGRSLFVCLIAAKVHTASLVAAPALYDVSASAYCDEIQRFIEQVHGDTVALTGLNFFYVTKDLVLSVAGTIVTYELVLLQFNGEDMIHKS